jgi:hypothetical protein
MPKPHSPAGSPTLYVAADTVLKMAMAARARRVIFMAAAIAIGAGRSRAASKGDISEIYCY